MFVGGANDGEPEPVERLRQPGRKEATGEYLPL